MYVLSYLGCLTGSLILLLLADYVRLLKYGDSLYRCKELKRAALVSPYTTAVEPELSSLALINLPSNSILLL